MPTKGGFYSEDTPEFVVSSNRWTLLFSWAWILKLWDFESLKLCHIRAWRSFEGSNKAPFCYLRLQSCFRPLFDTIWALSNFTNSKFRLRKITRFVCLRKWEIYQHFLRKSHLYQPERKWQKMKWKSWGILFLTFLLRSIHI